MLKAAALCVALVGTTSAAWAEAGADCADGKNLDLQIRSCTELIDSAGGSQMSRATAYLYRGLGYLNKIELDRAAPDLDEAIRLDPSSHQAYGLRGRLSVYKGNLDLALADFARALSLNPRDSRL